MKREAMLGGYGTKPRSRPLRSSLAALTAGCAGSDTAGSGSASIYVKDAPSDEFSEVHIVFTDVLVHSSGDDEDENETANDDADDNETDQEDDMEGGWIRSASS